MFLFNTFLIHVRLIVCFFNLSKKKCKEFEGWVVFTLFTRRRTINTPIHYTGVLNGYTLNNNTLLVYLHPSLTCSNKRVH